MIDAGRICAAGQAHDLVGELDFDTCLDLLSSHRRIRLEQRGAGEKCVEISILGRSVGQVPPGRPCFRYGNDADGTGT